MDGRDREKTISYAIIGGSILGILIISLLVIYIGIPLFSGEGYSELYFEEISKLPNVVTVGEPINFTFTVASHNNKPMEYIYNITYGDSIIQKGSFVLPEISQQNSKDYEYNKSITVHFQPKEITLIQLNESKLSTTKLSYSGEMGMFINPTGDAPQAVFNTNRLYYPVNLPGGGNNIAVLGFDPKKKETFSTTTDSIVKVNNIYLVTPQGNIISGEQISNAGYDVSQDLWMIENDHGTITATIQSKIMQLRYVFKRISVEVSTITSEGSKMNYEIRFWIVVKEDPNYFNLS